MSMVWELETHCSERIRQVLRGKFGGIQVGLGGLGRLRRFRRVRNGLGDSGGAERFRRFRKCGKAWEIQEVRKSLRDSGIPGSFLGSS